MLTAAQAIELKAKIKAEMLRRNGFGSLAEYGTSSYDFTENPTKDELIMTEHGQKTVDLLLKIEDYGDLTLSEKGSLIPGSFSEVLLTEVDRLATEEKTGESVETVKDLFPDRTAEVSSCRGDCTGLCVGSCTGLCNGCTGCTSTCGTGCASGCNTTCTGGCQGNCKGSCNTGCSTGCLSTCTGATKSVGK